LRDYYEQLWQRLPDSLQPPEFNARSRTLTKELKPGDRVLDLGCGEGTFTQLAHDAGAAQVLGLEVAQAAIDRAQKAHPHLSFALVPFDGPLPLEDASFDLVWVSEVIEHIADTAAWLSEVRRVLSPGGRLLITTPAHGRLRLILHGIERYSDPQGDHLHLYTARSLRALLADFDFEEIDVRALTGLPLLRATLAARAVRPGRAF